MARILVAYWTKTGTTRETAEEIGKVLSSRGHAVDLAEITAAGDPGAYDAVIIGAPINGMKWRPEALAFVEANAEKLRGRKVAYFCLTWLLFQGRASIRKAIGRAFDGASARVKPVKTALFGGRLPGPLPAPIRLLFGVPTDAPLDLVDLETVRSWAAEFAELL